MKKPAGYGSFFFKRLNKKGADVDGGEGGEGGGVEGSRTRDGKGSSWKLKCFKNLSSGKRWKRRFSLHIWFADKVLFKIVSVFEAIFLVSTLAFFYLCCGCHI